MNSANYVVTEFSEVQLGCGTLQRKEGDVILLLPALPYEGMKLFQEEVSQCSLLTVLGNKRTKPGKAEHLALRVVGLYQPVGVEQDTFAVIDFDLLLLVTHPRHKPKGHPPSPQFLGVPTTPEVGKVVASVGVAQPSALGLEDGVEAGDEHVLRDACQQRLVDSG